MSRDNLMTDIYGANLYNRYLAKHHTDMMSDTKLVAQGTGTLVPVVEELAFAAQCRSILVGRDPFLKILLGSFKVYSWDGCVHNMDFNEVVQVHLTFKCIALP